MDNKHVLKIHGTMKLNLIKFLRKLPPYLATIVITLAIMIIIQSLVIGRECRCCTGQEGKEPSFRRNTKEKDYIANKKKDSSGKQKASTTTQPGEAESQDNVKEQFDYFEFDGAWKTMQGRNFSKPKPIRVSSHILRHVTFPLRNFLDLEDRSELMNMYEFVMAISHAYPHRLHPITSLRHWFPEKVIHVFDLGLSSEVRTQLKTFCNVYVHTFNFSRYPEHVKNLNNFAYKPIIIHEMLSRYPGIVWLDSTEHLRYNTTNRWHQTALDSDGTAIFHGCPYPITAATHPDMYKYFSVQNITVLHNRSNSIGASAQLIFRTKFAYQHIYKWLFLCAMDKDCIAPEGSNSICEDSEDMSDPLYRNCHRYDQSLLTILYNHAYHSKIPFMSGYFYFMRQDSTSAELAALQTCEK